MLLQKRATLLVDPGSAEEIAELGYRREKLPKGTRISLTKASPITLRVGVPKPTLCFQVEVRGKKRGKEFFVKGYLPVTEV